MVKFFRCEKCSFQFVVARGTPDTMKCGAIVEYVVADNPDAGNDGPIKSEGLKPLGCGGNIVEISQEEAMNNV